MPQVGRAALLNALVKAYKPCHREGRASLPGFFASGKPTVSRTEPSELLHQPEKPVAIALGQRDADAPCDLCPVSKNLKPTAPTQALISFNIILTTINGTKVVAGGGIEPPTQ